MQKTDSLWSSVLFHAGTDIPLVLGLFQQQYALDARSVGWDHLQRGPVQQSRIPRFDDDSPANVVTIMTSPLCGTLVPAAGGRTELQGIGVQSYSIGWYTRSNFGGRSLAINLYEKSTLESLGLGYVADELEKGGKLGGM